MNEGRTSSRVRQWYEDDFDTEPDAVGDATVEGEYASDFEGADASIHEGLSPNPPIHTPFEHVCPYKLHLVHAEREHRALRLTPLRASR